MRCPVGSYSNRRTDLHHLTHEIGHVAYRLPAKSSQRMTNGPGVESLVADLTVILCVGLVKLEQGCMQHVQAPNEQR
jgi:hypothetical protein